MIRREHYLSQVRPFYESDLVKMITGIRRCGKSIILRQIQEELENQGKRCLFLDFDLRPTRKQIPDADALIAYIQEHLGSDKLFVFLDEIQNIPDWHEACRTLRLYPCSLFVTGSNSKLLSREFTKELSGRYVAFRVRPFVYREAKEYAEQLGRKYEISDYLVWGGFPAALELSGIEEDENIIIAFCVFSDCKFVNKHIVKQHKLMLLSQLIASVFKCLNTLSHVFRSLCYLLESICTEKCFKQSLL